MIKKFNEYNTRKINEDAAEMPTSIISTEDLVRQLSDTLGIDLDQFNVDDICNNIDIDGLKTTESIKVVSDYLKQLNS